MRKKVIIIDCNNLNKKELEDFQNHLFDNNHQWHSSKHTGERKYKERVGLLIIDDGELFNSHEEIIEQIKEEADIIRFNSAVEYTRHFKLKKIKTNIK